MNKTYTIPDGYAVYIRNTSAHFVDRIFDGSKCIETRTSPVLESCRGKWVKIVKTETHEIVGEVRFLSRKPTVFDSYESFDAKRSAHLVPKGSRFDWNGTKYGYYILATRKYEKPVPLAPDAKRYGRIAVEIDENTERRILSENPEIYH